MNQVLSARVYDSPLKTKVAKIIDEIYLSQPIKRPTDNINIGIRQAQKIGELFSLDISNNYDYNCEGSEDFSPIPSDILFANTIPIKHCRIDRPSDDIRWHPLDNGDTASTYTSNIEIFDKIHVSDEIYLTGLIVVNVKGPGVKLKVIYPILIENGQNRIKYTMVFDIWDNKKDHYRFAKRFTKIGSNTYIAFNIYFAVLMKLWYVSQIALLHPVVKESIVVRESTLELKSEHEDKKKSEKKKRPVEYVKVHIIDDSVIDAITTHKTLNRHAQCWYVIGHWRTYSSGKKIFIKPHWRGPLRHLKTPEETHARNLVVEGGET